VSGHGRYCNAPACLTWLEANNPAKYCGVHMPKTPAAVANVIPGVSAPIPMPYVGDGTPFAPVGGGTPFTPGPVTPFVPWTKSLVSRVEELERRLAALEGRVG
jgi:hypothetical protein